MRFYNPWLSLCFNLKCCYYPRPRFIYWLGLRGDAYAPCPCSQFIVFVYTLFACFPLFAKTRYNNNNTLLLRSDLLRYIYIYIYIGLHTYIPDTPTPEASICLVVKGIVSLCHLVGAMSIITQGQGHLVIFNWPKEPDPLRMYCGVHEVGNELKPTKGSGRDLTWGGYTFTFGSEINK